MNWGESMRNLINYYYQLEPVDIHQLDHYYTFQVEGDNYRLQEVEVQKVDLVYEWMLELYQKGIYTHQIIPTTFGEYIVPFNQKQYILLRTYANLDIPVTFDIVNQFQQQIYAIPLEKGFNASNWGELWSQKIDYFEYQMNQLGVKYPIIRFSFAYYIGLAEVGISLFNTYYQKDKPVILSHKRLLTEHTLYEFYDPLNLILDYRVRDLSEYLKSLYLKKEDIFQEVKMTLDLLDSYEKIMFFIRMIYPSFYFDCYEKIMANEVEEENLKVIIEKTKHYHIFLSKIYNYLSESMNLPYISWLKKM